MEQVRSRATTEQGDPASVEELVLLRTTVENWAATAGTAVEAFRRADGSFWKDSKAALKGDGQEAPHITTSARAYIALLYADRLRDTSKGRKPPEWAGLFGELVGTATVGRSGKRFYEARKIRKEKVIDQYEVNTFDIAHLADFFQVSEYLDRFYGLKTDPTKFFAAPEMQTFDDEPEDTAPPSTSASTQAALASVVPAAATASRSSAGVGGAWSAGVDGPDLPEPAPARPATTKDGEATVDTGAVASGSAAGRGTVDAVDGGRAASSTAAPVAGRDGEAPVEGKAAGDGEAPADGEAGVEPTPRDLIVAQLLAAIRQAAKPTDAGVGFPGEVRFEAKRPESRHYFATLHTLRALHALGVQEIDSLSAVVAGARSFAIEQAYYFQRGATHRQDPVRLAFAGCIYAIYDEHVDKDLCLAIVESLSAAQQENGSWPATHPVFRKNNVPWHIASHEVALCLSWLYFQPRVPDAARPLIVDMMRRYFLNGVIPTFYKANSRPGDSTAPPGSKLDGWQDDHTVSPDTTVGWATAIVCHFLGGYVQVLNDWINRRVIEELDLQLATERYLIDDTASSPSPRWSRSPERPFVWPDLPPHGWLAKRPTVEESKEILEENWTDPLFDAAICRSIAEKVLDPILANPSEQPQRDRCAGLMPGSPGTRKTSLVKQISKLTRWPMVAVPASSIFEEGFDRMEARANRVFGLLNHLRGCVIFFDEFEEFFLSRGEDDADDEDDAAATGAGTPAVTIGESGAETTKTTETGDGLGTDENKGADAGGASGGGTEAKKAKVDATDAYKSRTIAAFTTSAMLPRLQDLHDKDRCLIFLATNYPKKLDNAIKRAGRFDFTITVNHPDIARLDQYFTELNANSLRMVGLRGEKDEDIKRLLKAVRTAIATIASETGAKRMKFSVVEETLRTVRPLHDVLEEKLVELAAESLRRQSTAPSDGNPRELTEI